MSEGISAVLTYAVGVAISPVPIIAVILMLFSAKARVKRGDIPPGLALALTVVVALAYVLAGAAATATEETTIDTIAWGRLILGVLRCCWPVASGRAAQRRVRRRDAQVDGGINSCTPGESFGLALSLRDRFPRTCSCPSRRPSRLQRSS